MFESLLSDVRDRDRRFVVYRSGEGPQLDVQFANYDVDVVVRDLPSGGPDPFLVIESNGEFAGAISVAELDGLLKPPLVRPGDGDDVSEGYRVLFDLLEETAFSAMNRRQLLAVSREIEDRAYRVGAGTLRVSFQALSVFESQVDVYRHLAAETDLDIHVYGVEDWTPPEITGLTYHGYETNSLEPYWVLAFDGGPDSEHACGLLGREHSGRFDGFWTDDPALVDTLAQVLQNG